jgi:hypothetical protein
MPNQALHSDRGPGFATAGLAATPGFRSQRQVFRSNFAGCFGSRSVCCNSFAKQVSQLQCKSHHSVYG